MANKYTAANNVTKTHAECGYCHQMKLHADFHKDAKNKHRPGISYYCKECANEKARMHHALRLQNNPEYKRYKKDSYIKSRYGLTLSEYNEKLIAQKTCAICGVEISTGDPNTHLDHCHTTGKIRSFLCGNCNRGIGSFHDTIWKLEKAITYLKSHSEHENSQKGNNLS